MLTITAQNHKISTDLTLHFVFEIKSLQNSSLVKTANFDIAGYYCPLKLPSLAPSYTFLLKPNESPYFFNFDAMGTANGGCGYTSKAGIENDIEFVSPFMAFTPKVVNSHISLEVDRQNAANKMSYQLYFAMQDTYSGFNKVLFSVNL